MPATTGLSGYAPGAAKSQGAYILGSNIFPKPVGVGTFEILGKFAKAGSMGQETSISQKTTEVNLTYLIIYTPPASVVANIIIKIPPALRDDAISPLMTLRRVVESSFGFDVTIGPRTGRMILKRADRDR